MTRENGNAVRSQQITGGKGVCVGARSGSGELGGYPSRLGGWKWRCLPCVCVSLLPQESEHLRLAAFETYRALLAKVKRSMLVFPLRHQVLNLIVLLVAHLEDVNVSVAQVRGQALEPGLPLLVVTGGKC